MLYAEVVVPVPVRSIYQTFHYWVPEALQSELLKFSRVEVPFSGRLIQGFVIGFGEPPRLAKIKSIKGIVEKKPFLDEELFKTAQWMSQRYLCGLGDALHCIAGSSVPSRKDEKYSKGLFATVNNSDQAGLVRAPKQKLALEVALAKPGLNKMELATASSTSVAVINALIEKGLLKEKFLQIKEDISFHGKLPQLTKEQSFAVGEICQALTAEKPSAWLLHGVTGSGKTEIYLRIIQDVLKINRQAIVLVPEIALTPQMVHRFKTRYGNQVALLHSGLSQGERYAEKVRIRSGTAKVVLGTRSAVFAPTPNLGVIIIDEEHESSYKQDENPKYHAREVALQRAAQYKSVVVLGSATPALESFCRARQGGPYKLLRLTQRVDHRELPQVHIVDLREELARGNTGIFSNTLKKALSKRIEKKEKSILFLNRRGYATVVVCRQCGQVIKCPRCDISLTLHTNGLLRCHYCGYGTGAPKKCPQCASTAIRSFGLGTQRVEEEVKQLFPDVPVLRMDADTTTRKGSHQKLLDQFIQGNASVLIGTQMIAKGLDIPAVTLVGVVNADTTLHMPDFRAAERTFQLLTQVAGRAGRGETEGEVIIQTYDPEHFSILNAQQHDYINFYQKEMTTRKVLRYPPFSYIIRILFSGLNEGDVISAAQSWQERLTVIAKKVGNVDIEVLGPAPAGIPRIKDRYRWQLILRGSVSRDIRKIAALVLEQAGIRFKQVSVSIDVDPLTL
ncbi:replication restart DNA helicase PriA [Desulforamulus reducens MI-1]|uniref:Replication restart protein PriA n=1 Tax=Desulforamulus reducens (strain ATCC BAA-1160 / DSM 100696 / MI-1) TaxID=349161 RepID=A4J577_DESRM|nr:primosomal protein N' [Desulforamulus reducens]ABO50230.1 replication restart DNA helicase PriA [Desulforamulus reducens MI-1]